MLPDARESSVLNRPTGEQLAPHVVRSQSNESGAWPATPASQDNDNSNHPQDMEIKLEPEFYTCAFVSPLLLGKMKREKYERLCGEFFFTLAMLVVATMQCITVFGMSAYLVEREKGYQDEFRLSAMLFTEGGVPLSLGSSEDLCGTFSHLALEHIAGTQTLKMPDGTQYRGSGRTPLFHSYKMPSGSWLFTSIGGDESYMDKLLRVLHDDDWHLQRMADTVSKFRVQYGTLFVIMVAILWYHVLFEFRKIMRFGLVLKHLWGKGLMPGRKGTTRYDDQTDEIVIEHLNRNALIVGILCVTMRFTVVLMMLIWGTGLLAASWNKLSLVLNSLAIGIVFEIDVIIAYAVVDHNMMSRIEKIAPIKLRVGEWMGADNRKGMNYYDIFFSLIMLSGVIFGACLARSFQIDTNLHQLHKAAALCLFAGAPPVSQPDLLAPVPGFCESLLSLTCAPNVTGYGRSHGPCLVTDQDVYRDRSFLLYADGPLYDNMYDGNGKRRSMVDWGEPDKRLTRGGTWSQDPNLDLFRQACLQLYQPHGAIDKRVVDDSIGMTVYSAPFSCPRDVVFESIFGGAVHDFERWSKTFDLRHPDAIAALDKCHRVSHSEAPGKEASVPAVAPSVPNDVAVEDYGHPLPVNAIVLEKMPKTRMLEGPQRPAPKQSHHLRHHRQHHMHREVSKQFIREDFRPLNRFE